MSWITIIWSMTASACLTLGMIYFWVWCHRRTAWADLLFTLTSVGVAGYAVCELLLVLAKSPEEFATALRWLQLPTWVVVVSLAGFVRLHLRAGRLWLAWSIFALRTLALLLNFVTGQNLNYREVTALRHIPFLGETASLGVGISNPWMLVGQLSLLLLVVFTMDATITVWRRGDRRQALVTGGSIVFFALTGMIQAVLVLWGIVDMPLTESFCFLGIVLVMGYEMTRDALRAAQLADELRESEQRMALAAEAANLGVWVRDLKSKEIWATNKWRAMLGFHEVDHLDADRFFQKLHPDDRGRIQAVVQKALVSRENYEVEFRVPLPDGQVRWISSRGHVGLDGQGKPDRLLGVAIDISARKQAEEKFRLMVEASPSGIVLADREGRMVLVNVRTENLFGYSREELIGQSVEMLVPERFRAAHRGDRAGFMSKPEARAMGTGRELFALRKDGTEFPVEIGLSPIQSGDGTLILAVIVDLTARRQSEREITQQRNELAHLSRVSMLGELSGSLAHELNQPLTAILSNAQAAQRFLAHANPDLKEVRDILADIVAEDKRAGEVIRRLRLLLKKGEVQRQLLSANDLVLEVLKLVRNDLVNQNIIAHAELAVNPPLLHADRVSLQQVLINLVINACDAMAETTGQDRQFTISTELADNHFVLVSVVDHGTGIAPEKLEQVFAPFYTTKAHGMGLGLSVCRTIITAHGGKLWAANNSGRGATFYFTLPLAQMEQL